MALVNGGFLHYTDGTKFLKILFSEIPGQILDKFHRNVPWMTFPKKEIGYGPLKNLGERSRTILALLLR